MKGKEQLKGKTKFFTFSQLVAAIDKKWGHTYEDPKPEEGTILVETVVKHDNSTFLVIEEKPLK
jgi:hypothetical protein